MLDSETKRRINTCRDILVGKVPDPKSQVEQITIALIYKFMDDMDLESEQMGGARKFFTGDFERYAWAKLVAPGVGGQEMLNTYSEALAKMPENEVLPVLFRDIFRNAFLPYRDPETLRSFLREINGFTYDHSERLGDAFEYLLSVLGSQGDAGQFRTPRHIIDFMVEIIDPRKDEVILDPACGTAGFLISSFKHILKANSTNAGGVNGDGAEIDAADATLDSPLRYAGDLLTPEDRRRLALNIKGYDISPDMVRLSLVNLYLHGFADPRVEEYDTLTSDDKWNETADVILANPPFMSPKGGIKPHNRFGVPSKRSEVLFVDYIAEHLSLKGRAAIVVPEGIIFQSQSAYCDLRRMLVDKYLAAVISLPAGVFNPYSGVKTSILILDRAAAKASDSIAFFNVKNDGFGLGAQRRALKGSQLPQVKAEVGAWLAAARSGIDAPLEPSLGFAVNKERVAESGEYNLSGERYREGEAAQSEFPLVSLGDLTLFKVESGGTPKTDIPEYWDGDVRWATLVDLPPDDFISQITDTKRTISDAGLANSSAKVVPENSIIVSTRATIGRIGINRVPIATNQGFKNVVVQDHERACSEFVALALTRLVPTMKAWATGGTFAEISKSKFCELEIPLPPLDVQQAMVAEIKGYQKVIDGARMVLENYRPHISADPAWPMVAIGDCCRLINGRAFKPSDWESEEGGGLPIIRIQNLNNPFANLNYYSGDVKSQFIVEPGELLFSWSGSRGTSFGAHIWNGGKAILNQHIFRVLLEDSQTAKSFMLHILNAAVDEVEDNLHGGVGLVHITKGNLEKIKIPLPPLETQQAIVAEIECEQALVNANRELTTRFKAKIEQAIARVWGKAAERDSEEDAD
ncbi:N-6 DNA methylase [Pararhizobium sp.]|uniref:N-6 DNA methylase n=1 Tax=Pararhizobium sp. TaxID=1977563 RepID=UPI002715A606|nr:N-6 DNA methylase [Pararhizobium sp.]MDO9414506.1 N-6 DNA methylase [Pararhizobium sp.]